MKKVLLTIVLGLFAVGCETPLGPDYGDYDPWEQNWYIVCYDENWFVNTETIGDWETYEECEEDIHENSIGCHCEYL